MKHQFAVVGRLLPLLVILAGIGGFVALGSRPAVEPKDRGDAVLPLVEVVTTQKHEQGLDFKVDGVAVPYRELLLTAKVGGSIDVKADVCKAGRFVKKNTVLMEIDPRDFRLEVERLTQELRQAEGNLKEVDVEATNTGAMLKLAANELELREKELARSLRLFGRDVGTDSEIDAAKRNKLQAENSQLTLQNDARLLAAKRERLIHAKALVQSQLDKANLDLQRTRIVAPVDGVIVKDHVEAGTYVQTGATLITFEDTSAIEVRCNLRMEELNWLWKQRNPNLVKAEPESVQTEYQFPTTEATVVYELSGQRFTWRGNLSRYDGVGLDERTRTVPCRVFVDNPRAVGLEGSDGLASDSPTVSGPPALVRGMFVSVRIHARPNVPLLRLPERAIRPGNEVWLVRNGKLDRCHVTVALVTPAGVLIDASRSDLSPGDQVITTPMTATPKADGLGYIEEGMPVRIKKVSHPQL